MARRSMTTAVALAGEIDDAESCVERQALALIGAVDGEGAVSSQLRPSSGDAILAVARISAAAGDACR